MTRLRKQDFAFYTAAAYLMFEYLRPHTIYSMLDVLPWARLTILTGLFYALVAGRVRLQGMHVALFLFMIVAIISSYLSYDTTASFNRLYYIYSWFIVDRKSTRLNSSHVAISYAVFCLYKTY